MSTLVNRPDFASLLQDFFCCYLIDQRNLSPQTIASYRDTFRLLLGYLQDAHHLAPSNLTFAELNTEVILDFLRHIEQDRGNATSTRNVRLAAIRSFAKYAGLRDPGLLANVQALLAIPLKRTVRPLLGFLDKHEIEAIIHAPDVATWSGRRDRILFATYYNTGARVSELTTVKRGDVDLARSHSICLQGKGRKQRRVPLWKQTVQDLDHWLRELEDEPDSPVFPNRQGKQLTRAGVEYRLQKAVATATKGCPSLDGRKISPHIIRHTTAMHLLQAGVAPTVIALWLGHESPTTTQIYIEADLAMKERALAAMDEPSSESTRYTPPDDLLAFLEGL